MCTKTAMVSSVDPDQTARIASSLISVFSNPSVPILRIFKADCANQVLICVYNITVAKGRNIFNWQSKYATYTQSFNPSKFNSTFILLEKNHYNHTKQIFLWLSIVIWNRKYGEINNLALTKIKKKEKKKKCFWIINKIFSRNQLMH